MRLVVITPVGPGHEQFVEQAMRSVTVATDGSHRFTEVRHVIVDDARGQLGRSRARNLGMRVSEWADWYFFLDADDAMCPGALALCDFDVEATFGMVWHLELEGRAKRLNVYPCGWREVGLYGARCTLSMGCFVRADVARHLKFNESMNVAEDYDFYVRLSSFTKVEEPLVKIGYRLPSAGGPRGYDEIDWVGACDEVIRRDYARDPEKYDLRGDAILAKAARTSRQRRELLTSLSEGRR